MTGSAILSPQLRAERAHIRAETDEWYRMLEEYIASKEETGAPLTLKPGEAQDTVEDDLKIENIL